MRTTLFFDPSIPAENKAAADLSKRVAFALFAIALLAGVLLRLMEHPAVHRTPDEQIYSRYAEGIARFGWHGASAWLDRFNSHPEMWIYPSPIRIGYTGLLAGLMHLCRLSAEQAGILVSNFSSVAALLLTAWIALRFFGLWAALAAILFMSVFPVDLAVEQRIWQDGFFGALGYLLFYLALEVTLRERPLKWLLAYWVTAAWLATVKESSVIIYGLCTAWVLASIWVRDRSVKKCLWIAAGSVVAGLVAVGAMCWCLGGLGKILTSTHNISHNWSANDYTIKYASGPWYSFAVGFFVLSPLTTVLSLMGLGLTLVPGMSLEKILPGAAGRAAARFTGAFLLALLTVATLTPQFKCLRFVTVLDGPICMLAGLTLVWLHRVFASRFRPVWLPLISCLLMGGALLGATLDYGMFQRVFVRRELNDLAINRVVECAMTTWTEDPREAGKAPSETAAGAPLSH